MYVPYKVRLLSGIRGEKIYVGKLIVPCSFGFLGGEELGVDWYGWDDWMINRLVGLGRFILCMHGRGRYRAKTVLVLWWWKLPFEVWWDWIFWRLTGMYVYMYVNDLRIS